MMKRLAYLMILGSPHVGRKVAPISTVCGYREIEKDGKLFRSHPFFLRRGVGMTDFILNGMIMIDIFREV